MFQEFANVTRREETPRRRCTCRHASTWLFQNNLKHTILLTCIVQGIDLRILSLIGTRCTSTFCEVSCHKLQFWQIIGLVRSKSSSLCWRKGGGSVKSDNCIARWCVTITFLLLYPVADNKASRNNTWPLTPLKMVRIPPSDSLISTLITLQHIPPTSSP